MKLWVDDLRKPPSDEWTWVTNYNTAYKFILGGHISAISLDHDLGSTKTGYDLVKLIEQLAYEGKDIPRAIYIHSANPVGRKNMIAGIRSINNIKVVLNNVGVF